MGTEVVANGSCPKKLPHVEHPTKEQIGSVLIGIISLGFDRSLNALAEAGAIDTKKLREHYKGSGSKNYDLVTAQIELTAHYGAERIRSRFSSEN